MAAMDEFRMEREAIKNAPFKKKVQYFLDYYKWPTIIIIVLIVMVTACVVDIVTAPEILMDGVMLNTYSTNGVDDIASDLKNEFMEQNDIDSSEYALSVNTSLIYAEDDPTFYSSSQAATEAIITQSGAGVLDFMTGDLSSMTDFSYANLFTDLSTVLTEEQMETYAPYFLYIDKVLLEELEAAFENNEENVQIEIIASDTTEGMEKPIPIFIDMSESQKLSEVYEQATEPIVFGFIYSCDNLELACAFMDYLMSE